MCTGQPMDGWRTKLARERGRASEQPCYGNEVPVHLTVQLEAQRVLVEERVEGKGRGGLGRMIYSKGIARGCCRTCLLLGATKLKPCPSKINLCKSILHITHFICII